MGNLNDRILQGGFVKLKKSVVAADMVTATPKTLFTVTGTVEVQIVPVVTTAVTRAAGALTLEIGIAGNTAALVAQCAKALLVKDAVFNGAAAANPAAAPDAKVIAGSKSIILTTGGGDADAGAADVYCRWRPISSDGNVVAA